MKKMVLPFLLLAGGLHAQFDSTVYKLAQTIQASTLHDHVFTLASPEFEGRETGTEGNHKAAVISLTNLKQMDPSDCGRYQLLSGSKFFNHQMVQYLTECFRNSYGTYARLYM
jgi:hypothetical protein